MANIRDFLAALWTEWWPLMSCAAFTALSVIAARVKKDPSKWIVRGTSTLAVFFFGLASFFAWNAEHQVRLTAEKTLKDDIPQLSAEIGTIMTAHYTGHGMKNATNLTLYITITNHGSPSAFSVSRVLVNRPNGQHDEAIIVHVLPSNLQLPGARGQPNVSLPRTDALVFLEKGRPIEKGGALTGWIMCIAPTVSDSELENRQISVTFEGGDINGKLFSATRTIHGTSSPIL
jgi:hypothetical protein